MVKIKNDELCDINSYREYLIGTRCIMHSILFLISI